MSSSCSSLLGSTSDSSPPGSPIPRKKQKHHIDSKYQHEWSSKYRMKPSRLGETYAYCTVCNIDFSVAGGGVFQVKRHCESKRHISSMKGISHQSTIHEALSSHKKNEALKEQVTSAELSSPGLLWSTICHLLLETTSVICVQ